MEDEMARIEPTFGYNPRTAYKRDSKIVGTEDQINALIVAMELEGIWPKFSLGSIVKRLHPPDMTLYYIKTPKTRYMVDDTLWRAAKELAKKIGIKSRSRRKLRVQGD
jgi:hypothetical protein